MPTSDSETVILYYKEYNPDKRPLWSMPETEVSIHPGKVGECEGWLKSTPIEFWISQVKYSFLT